MNLSELADLLGQVKPPTASKDEIDKSGLEIIKASGLPQYEKDGKVSSNCLDRVRSFDLPRIHFDYNSNLSVLSAWTITRKKILFALCLAGTPSTRFALMNGCKGAETTVLLVDPQWVVPVLSLYVMLTILLSGSNNRQSSYSPLPRRDVIKNKPITAGQLYSILPNC